MPFSQFHNNTLYIIHNTLSLGMTLALVALLAVNIFSPYLNHPLGIGFIILSFALTCPPLPAALGVGRQVLKC